MATNTSALVKKTKIVPFINTGTADTPVWTQIKKSTAFQLAMNPQTKTFDFISDDSPDTEVDSYQPSLPQSITMFKGEKDYQTVFDMLYNRCTGADAHRDALLVFYQETATAATETVYKAWKVDSVVQINTLDSVAESIDFTMGFNDIVKGAVSTATGSPVFTEGDFTASNGAYTFTASA